MLLRPALLSSTLALLAFAGAAKAAEPVDAPWFVGVRAGRSSVSSKVYQESHDPIFGFEAGYAFNRNFAIEAYAQTLSFRIFDGLAGDNNFYPSDHLGVQAVGTLPLTDAVGLFAGVGVGRTRMHSASGSLGDYRLTDPSVSAGLDFKLGRNWSLQVTGMRLTKTEVNTLQVGVQYRF